MRQRNLLYLDMHCLEGHHPRVARKTISVSYDPDLLGIDIGDAIKDLQRTAGSPYFARSLADIGGLLLAERLQSEKAGLTPINKSARRGA